MLLKVINEVYSLRLITAPQAHTVSFAASKIDRPAQKADEPTHAVTNHPVIGRGGNEKTGNKMRLKVMAVHIKRPCAMTYD